MTKREDRDTYLPDSEVVERVADTSDKISHYLQNLRRTVTDEKAQLSLENLIRLQDELTAKIRDYGETAPRQVRETYVQYVDPGSGKVDDMISDEPESRTADEITATALALNEELAQELQPVSINEGIPEVAEAFDNMRVLVEETRRRISMDQSMASDM